MSADEDEIPEVSEVDLADSAEPDTYDPQDREVWTDEREEPLEEQVDEVEDDPDPRGDEPPEVD